MAKVTFGQSTSVVTAPAAMSVGSLCTVVGNVPVSITKTFEGGKQQVSTMSSTKLHFITYRTAFFRQQLILRVAKKLQAIRRKLEVRVRTAVD